MTALMIFVGLSDQPGLAAEIGIVHGATLALFFAFSANGRSLILSQSSLASANSIMLARLILVIPLAVVAYFLTVSVGVISSLAIVLIFRRIVEWLGEVHLSEMERFDKKRQAATYLVINIFLLLIAFFGLVLDIKYPLFGVWLWALVPLLLHLKALIKAFLAISESLHGIYLSLLPHFGSSSIIGITVYVFRLFLLFLLGKETSGDLFTAFAIGGLLGSIFANALGASLTFYEQQTGKYNLPPFLTMTLTCALLLGIFIFIVAFLHWHALEFTGKEYLFWEALGLSLIGSVIMVYAQRIRFRLLQNDGEHDVFGPDVMMNILLLASVPFGFYLLGKESMAGLYLLSSLLAYIFYLSYQKGFIISPLYLALRDKVRVILVFSLLFPLFFQASHGVFRDTSMTFDSGGRITNLPIPLSVLACFIGIVLLGKYKMAYSAFVTIFLTCVLMLVSILCTGSVQPIRDEAKLILMIQYLLPMFAMVLGQMFTSDEQEHVNIGKIFVWVLIVIVPLQLGYSWYKNVPYLLPSLWGGISIYQHLQYVPVVLVSAYMIAIFALWNLRVYRWVLLILSPIMAIYVSASLSMLAIGLISIGFLVWALYQWRLRKEKVPTIIFILVGVLTWSFMQHAMDNKAVAEKFSSLETLSWQGFIREIPEQTKMQEVVQLNTVESEDTREFAPNIEQRLIYWKYYLSGIMNSTKTIIFGNDNQSDRSEYSSAHNYYLDFMYNFGLIALCPLLALLTYSCFLFYRHRKQIYLSPRMAGLSMVVFFLLFVDNSFKVGLSQPYSGIFTFFLWGLLLNNLLILNTERKP